MIKKSPYPNLSMDGCQKCIVQAQNHNLDLTNADKTAKFYHEVGNTYGAQEPIMIVDVCQGLHEFHNENKIESSIMKFLYDHLWNIGYLEDKQSWNEFSEIIANSDILRELQNEKKCFACDHNRFTHNRNECIICDCPADPFCDCKDCTGAFV